MTLDTYDVAIVGAGPAGTAAAIAALQGGASVALLDRNHFPRYKTCGGGLIGVSLQSLPGDPPIRMEARTADFTRLGGRSYSRFSDQPFMRTATREELDSWLVSKAQSMGAHVITPFDVRDFVDEGDHVVLRGPSGSIGATFVIGADGSASRLARHVGVQLDTIDLGLELELATPRDQMQRWSSHIHLDWGLIPGSYAWVFPKGDTLTVGVIAAKGEPARTKEYLREFVGRMRLDSARVLHDSGHLTRTRTPQSPVARGRILLAGDAAGLLEPWTREGISFALRSGRLAGTIAARGSAGSLDPATTYAMEIQDTLAPEMAAGRRCLRAFERHPNAFHHLIGGNEFGWRYFRRMTLGDTNLARALSHIPIRLGLKTLENLPSGS